MIGVYLNSLKTAKMIFKVVAASRWWQLRVTFVPCQHLVWLVFNFQSAEWVCNFLIMLDIFWFAYLSFADIFFLKNIQFFCPYFYVFSSLSCKCSLCILDRNTLMDTYLQIYSYVVDTCILQHYWISLLVMVAFFLDGGIPLNCK